MRIQHIDSYRANSYRTNSNKIRQSNPSFNGIQEVVDEYDKKIKGLGWWKKHFTNAEELLKMQQTGAILGYARAQEAITLELQKEHKMQETALKEAQKNNLEPEELEKLKTKAKELETLLQIQQNLMKVKENKGWDRIAGYDSEKAILSSEFIQALGLEKIGQEVFIPNGILFFGPTGNGKTTFSKAFAEQAQCNLIEVDSLDEDDFIKDLSKALKESKSNYDKHNIRSIILIDEFEKYGLSGEKGGNKQLIANLKSIMQSCSDKYKATLFLTTNNPLDIDPILLVDSRVPVRVYLDPPDKMNAERVFEYYIKDKTTNNINLNSVVNELFENQGDGAYSNSRIKTIVETCYKEAVAAKRLLTEGDLMQKIKETLPDIKKVHLEKYANDVKEIIGIVK